MKEWTKEDRTEAFHEFLRGVMTRERREAMAEMLDRMGFFAAPASTRYHGSFAGGLFDHSLDVGKNLVFLTDRLDLRWQKPRSPFLVGLMHDLCKCDQYGQNPDGSWFMRKNITLSGHGDKSVILAQRVMEAAGLALTEEEILCIRWHMGGYDDAKQWPYVGTAIERYSTVLFTHTADMMASRVHNI